MTVPPVLPRLGAIAVLALALLAPPPAAASPQEAQALILRLEQEGLSLARPGMPLHEKEQRFRAALRSYFDLPAISRFVLGRHWNTASPEERQQFIALFEDLTTYTWARRFDEYDGQGLQILGIADTPDGYAVQTAVLRARGQPVPVTWRVAETGAGPRVVDIVIEGVSMAITHRSEYAATLRRGGMPGLLAAMQQQVAVAR